MSTSTEDRQPVTRHTQDDRTDLPTFTSIRDQSSPRFSFAESSNASSSRSAPRRSPARSEDGSQSRDSPNPGPNGLRALETPPTTNGTIRRGKRASGGFLLDSSPTSSKLAQRIVSREHTKGKRVESSGLFVPKRRTQIDGQEGENTRRSSPLSSDITSLTNANDTDVLPMSSRGSRESPLNPNRNQRYGRDASSSPAAPSLGLDTDPAQIVEMALRLNEGRRRQAAEKRYVSSSAKSNRAVSAATAAPVRVATPVGNHERSNYVTNSASRRKSLNPNPLTPIKPSAQSVNTETLSPTFSNKTSPEQGGTTEPEDMRISRATQKRVDQAKEYFELAHEYRRLLLHLPPLRRPDTAGPDNRSYNPLQYVRNRKLRFRERAPIDSEGDGWHDIGKVKPWVEAVVSSHIETRHDPLECVRLPPLSMREIPEDELDHDSNEEQRKTVQPSKPRRPRSDWVTHPGDLMADAFWIEQGLNKQKIYNRDNEPIYPPGTQFHFSGWRNRTPISVPGELQTSSSPQVSPTATAKEAISSPLDLPTFESAHKDRKWVRRKSKLSKSMVKDAISAKKSDRKIFDTSSSESANSSDDEKERRGRKRLPQQRRNLQLPEGDPFDPPVKTIEALKKQSRSVGSDRSPRHSTDRSSLLKHVHSRNNSMAEAKDDSEAQRKLRRRYLLQGLSLDQDLVQGRNSLDDDSTAPGTPNVYGFPSIAMSLSPPGSRDASPSKKGKGSFFDMVKDKVHTSKDKVDRTDFADHSSGRGSRDHSVVPHQKRMSLDWSRGPSPMGRGPSPFSRQRTNLSVDESAYSVVNEPRGSTISRISSKTTDTYPQRSHRVRGMFKGGRIAELVGNEVSKVGDFIWKRDPPIHRNVVDGSISGYESDSDEMPDPKEQSKKSPVQERPTTSHSYASTNSVTSVSAASKSPPRAAPQFHIQGLPSFTSPFQKDRETQERNNQAQSPGGTPQLDPEIEFDSDHISKAVVNRRAGRSPRLDRMAPPRLDVRSATPEGRRNSYGFGTALDLTRTKSASQEFNSAINGRPRDGRTSTEKFASKSLAVPRSSQSERDESGSSSKEDHDGKPKKVTIHDFARVRALLFASTIKATKIAAYCEAIPKPQSAFLFSAFHATNASGSEINQHLPVARKEEHIVAARHLIEYLNSQSSDLNDRLENFTRMTTNDLHRQVQILEDRTESTLFPRLSRLSDQAGQLAQKLTTTSTLAVKGVNDEVNEAIRFKRRGGLRWSRLLGYKLIEIGVVGLLWVVWFVVTIIRFAIAFFRTSWAIIAWLFFLR